MAKSGPVVTGCRDQQKMVLTGKDSLLHSSCVISGLCSFSCLV